MSSPGSRRLEPGGPGIEPRWTRDAKVGIGTAYSTASRLWDILLAPQAKWWLVGMVLLALGAWELSLHHWRMHLPAATVYPLDALVGASLVGLVLLAAFALIQRREQQLATTAESLRRTSEALRSLEAERDSRLVDLARDLAVVLAEIIERCEIAERLPEAEKASEALTAVKARADELGAIVRSLVELKQEGAAVVTPLPEILVEYQRHREEHLQNREWYQQWRAAHPSYRPYVILEPEGRPGQQTIVRRRES
jgi:signal transduction histidine kinase